MQSHVPGLPTHIAAGADLAVDVAIIGSGVAGLVTALDLLARRDDVTVALIDKGVSGQSGSTPLAQGGLAAAVSSDDSAAFHAADTFTAGVGHGDPRAVAVMAAETPARVADLRARGAVFDTDADGTLALAREGGQRVGRSVRAADATGAEIFRALRTSAVDHDVTGGRLMRLQGMAVRLTTADTADAPVNGLWLYAQQTDSQMASPSQDGGLVLVRAKAVMVATGGCGGIYAGTTNRDNATGDGINLANQVGAAVQDMEFVQFHPTGLKAQAPDRFQRFLLTEALRGAGATLLDADGNRFMTRVHPDAELAPRHIVAKAILDQPGGAWLDATMLPAAQLREEFPTVLAGAAEFGFDLASEPVPVEPCEHYMIGGIATDLRARASVPGLYAAGEAASSGVHGANRMAGNSLAQSCVFAHRAAVHMAAHLPDKHDGADPAPPPVGEDGDMDLSAVRREVRLTLSRGAGPIRDAASMATAEDALTAISRKLADAWGGSAPPLDRDALEIANMLVAAELILTSAACRQESRGTHIRSDFPDADPAWAGRRQIITAPAGDHAA